MKKAILFFSLLFLSLVSGHAVAQQGISLKSLQIELWPEYDRPTLLVIYRGELSPEVQLPVDITIRIPAAAGEPNAVAVRQMNGTLFNAIYTREVRGDWAYITFTSTLPEFQVEYYDPRIEKQGDKRKMVYEWPGDYAVEALMVIAQQPAGAINMQLTPQLSNITSDANGLVYYSAELGSLKEGEAFDLTISYQRSSDALTVESLPIEPVQPVTQETKGRVMVTEMIPWGLGVLGVVMLAGGVYWYWVSGRRKAAAPPPRRRRRVRYEPESEPEEQGIYCPQCGKRAAAGDRFCRACGTRLRE